MVPPGRQGGGERRLPPAAQAGPLIFKKGQADDDLQDSNRMTMFTKSPYEGRNSQIDNDLVLEHLKE